MSKALKYWTSLLLSDRNMEFVQARPGSRPEVDVRALELQGTHQARHFYSLGYFRIKPRYCTRRIRIILLPKLCLLENK